MRRPAWPLRWLALAWLAALPWLGWPAPAGAQQLVPVPPLAAPVTDLTGTLTGTQTAALDRQLLDFSKRKGSQIAVLIVPTTAPETIEQYSIRVAEAWKLGRKGQDDGVLLLVAKNDHALRIEVGYGLEGAIPDAISSRVIREIITPRFRQGDFYGGLQAGVDQIVRLIDGEQLPAPKPSGPRATAGSEQVAAVVLLAAVFVGQVVRALLGRAIGAGIVGGIAGVVGWWFAGSVLLGLLVGLAAFAAVFIGVRFGGFGPGGFGGGGGLGGGSSPGGFSGGGGGFGGGGASGRW